MRPTSSPAGAPTRHRSVSPSPLADTRLGSFLSPPDADLVRAGVGGERLIARIRLLFFSVLMVVPVVINLMVTEPRSEFRIASVGAFTGFAAAALIYWQVYRRGRIPALALITTAFDITLVTGVLVALALSGRPMVAVNSLALWPLYLLFIFSTCLRFDHRVTLLAGALSLVQSLGVVVWVDRGWDLSIADPVYGSLSWPAQVSRAIVLVAATALTIGIVRRSRRLILVAGTDVLTGLWNRTYFNRRLATEVARAERRGNELAIAFLDIDRFKRVNDLWGHDVGDAVLRAVARILESHCRREDVVARWGGEEFVLILPATGVEGAVEQVERVRSALATAEMPVPDPGFRLTVSAGITGYPTDGRVADALVAIADRRLLEAKRTGRDRVVSMGAGRDLLTPIPP